MSIGIAAVCRHDEGFAIVLCADWQGTRGEFIKADDTYKIRTFPNAGLLIAGDVDAGAEFAARFEGTVRDFNKIKKTKDDMDLRIGTYLAALRKLAQSYKLERTNHYLITKHAISLKEFYSAGIEQTMSSAKYNEIADDVKNVNLGAEFIFAYMADEEPILIRIYQNGRVSWEEGEFMAIGAGEPIVMAIHCQIDFYGYLNLTECLIWVSQIKSAAEQNPYVGRSTTIVVLLPDGKEEVPGDAMWRFLRTRLPRAVRFPNNAVKEIQKKKIPLFDSASTEELKESPSTSPVSEPSEEQAS